MLSKVKSGDTVAVRAGDSFGAQAINQAGVALLGGFVVCAPNRWVRDPGQRSTLSSASDVLVIPGTVPSPLPDVTVANFDLVGVSPPPAATEYHALNATRSDNLTLSNLSATLVQPPPGDSSAGPAVTGFAVASSAGVSFSDLVVHRNHRLRRLPGPRGAALCRSRNGAARSRGRHHRRHRTRRRRPPNTPGAVTIDSVRSDGGTVGHGLVRASRCPTAPAAWSPSATAR